MAFTFSQPRRMNPEESSPYNNLLSNALKSYQQQVSARYAPQREQAEIIGKGIGPLAQIAISPLMTGMGPAQQQQMLEYISKIMGGMNQGGGMPQMGGGMGQPQQGGGLLDNIRQMFGGGQPQQQPIQQGMVSPEQQPSNQGGNEYGLLPGAGRGVQGGAAASAVAPLTSSPIKSGVTYQNPETGEVLSAPTGETTSNAQSSIVNIKNAEPVLKNLVKEAKPFLEKGGALGLKASQAAGELRKLGVSDHITNLLGGTKLANKYAKFTSSQAKSVDKLMKIYQLPANVEAQHTVEKIITPQKGEDEKGYEQRINKELSDFSGQVKRNKNVLGSGISLSQKQRQNKSNWDHLTEDQLVEIAGQNNLAR